MKLDHIAYRVQNRDKTAEFLHRILKYNTETEFEIVFDNNATADCLVLTPPTNDNPELFVSDGTEDSIVGEWVKNHRNGQGGIHHLAYKVDKIEEHVGDVPEEFIVILVKASICDSNVAIYYTLLAINTSTSTLSVLEIALIDFICALLLTTPSAPLVKSAAVNCEIFVVVTVFPATPGPACVKVSV